MGPDAVHKKYYTIILSFLDNGSSDSVDNLFALSIIKAKLFELLAEYYAQNCFINVVLHSPDIKSKASSILARLSKEVSMSKLAVIQCKVGDSQNPFQNALSVPMDFLLNLISTHKSLQQLDFDVPGLNDLICAHFMVIKSALTNNRTLRKLTICDGLLEFKRNEGTNEMELTTPLMTNLPLKLISSTSPIIMCDQMLSSLLQAKRPCK